MSVALDVLPPIPLLLARDDDPGGVRLRNEDSLVRVRHKVYAPASAWKALAPWQRYTARVLAYALVAPDAVFALESAAALQGLPVFGEPRDIHTFDEERATSTRYGDIVVHTSADAPIIERRNGRNMTSVAHTTVALGRALPPAFGLAVWDAFLRREGHCRLSELRQLAHTQVSHRGRKRLRWLGERARAESESPGESVSRAVIEWLGFSDPALQREFRHEGAIDRSDFFWERERVIGESDGYGKYAGSTPGDVQDHFTREKLREDRLRRHVRGFARWDWADSVKAHPLGDKLCRAGLTARYPLNSPALVTLRRNPRSL